MTIDPRSQLGERLDVTNPAEIDLRQLDEAAASLLVDRMGDDVTREEALIRLLNFAGKLMADGVVHIDTKLIYSAHKEVPTAVEQIRRNAADNGKPLTVAKSLTKLVVMGSRVVTTPAPKKEDKTRRDSSVQDLLRDMFGTDFDKGPFER